MSEVQDYNSSLSDAAQSRKFETFSYLPPLSKESARAQIQYIVDKGWNPGIEHTEPENARSNYWYMWKLPMFGETNVDTILAEARSLSQGAPGQPCSSCWALTTLHSLQVLPWWFTVARLFKTGC